MNCGFVKNRENVILTGNVFIENHTQKTGIVEKEIYVGDINKWNVKEL